MEENNVMRHEYRQLSDVEKEQMQQVKDKGLEFYNLINQLRKHEGAVLRNSRELDIAQEKIEEAVMWCVKHITG